MSELTVQDLEQGFVRPMRTRVRHLFCDSISAMRITDAVSLALDPSSKSECWCLLCGRRLPASQFTWFPDLEPVGS